MCALHNLESANVASQALSCRYTSFQNVASDANSSHHGTVETELHRNHTVGQEVWTIGYPCTHRLDRENIRICILNGQAVAGIRVITGPEFLSKFTIEFL